MLRFAPKLSNEMQIQDLRIALLNYLVSKQKNINFTIRIEDIEEDKESYKQILKILNLFSIDYIQITNQKSYLKHHQKIAMQFLIDSKAFNCFCSKEALQKDEDELKAQGKPYEYSGFCENLHDEVALTCEAPFVVRIKKPLEDIKFVDKCHGQKSFKPSDIDSFVILTQEKKPTYNFACAIDDMLENIDIIIQDEKHVINTPKQIFIRKLLNYDKEIEYIHVPSLKTNNLTVESLLDDGYLPIAIVNYLLTLGFETPKLIFTLEEALEWFNITQISKENLSFNMDILKQINIAHMKDIDNLRLSKLLGYADEDIGKLAKIYLDRYYTLKEIKSVIDTIFAKRDMQVTFVHELKQINECLNNAPFIDDFNNLKKYILNHTGIQKDLSKILKYVLTGTTNCPELEKIYPLIKNYLGEIIK